MNRSDILEYVSGRLTVLEKRFSDGKYITHEQKTLLYGRVSELEALLYTVDALPSGLTDRISRFMKFIFEGANL